MAEKKGAPRNALGIEAEIPQDRLWRDEELERIARSCRKDRTGLTGTVFTAGNALLPNNMNIDKTQLVFYSIPGITYYGGNMKDSISFDIRQKVISTSTSSGWMAPHISYVYEADATELMIESDKLIHNKPADNKITFNTILMRVVIEGIKAAPGVNAHVFYNKWLSSGNIKIIDKIDINTPVLLPDKRMVTIKLPDCGNKSLEEIAFCFNQLTNKLKNTNIDIALLNVGWEDTIKRLKQGNIFTPMGRIAGLKFGKNKLKRIGKFERDIHNKAPKESRLGNDDLNMGTITISNLGSAVRGTKGFPAIINLVSPQVMAIGIGALQEKPIIYQSHITPRKIIPFCIVFDHRALDFGDAAPLIKKMDLIFQNPDIIHTW